MSDILTIAGSMAKSNGIDYETSIVIDAVKNTALKYISEQLTDETNSVYCLGCGETDFLLPDVNVYYNDLCADKLERMKKRFNLDDDNYFLACDAIDVKPKENAVAVCNFSFHDFALDDNGDLDEKRLSKYVSYLAENYGRILIGEAGQGFPELFSGSRQYLTAELLSGIFEKYGFDVKCVPINLSENMDLVVESTPKISSLGCYTDHIRGEGIVKNYLENALSDLENDTLAYVLDITKKSQKPSAL